MKVSRTSAFEKYSQNTINKTAKVLLKKDCQRLKYYYILRDYYPQYSYLIIRDMIKQIMSKHFKK